METKSFPSKLTIVIIVTPLLAFVGVLWFIIYPNQLKTWLDAEVFKLVFQFLLLIVLGGLVTFLFTSFTKEKEKRLTDNENKEIKKSDKKNLQHKFHNDFIQSYNSVKLIRRMLRARARILSIDEKGKEKLLLDTKEYDRQMQELTKLQLNFEFYIDEVESNPNLFTEKRENVELKVQLNLIGEYLNELVSEYENCFRTYANKYYINEVPALLIDSTANLNKLNEFIIKYELAAKFKTNFKEPGNKIQKIILSILNNKKA